MDKFIRISDLNSSDPFRCFFFNYFLWIWSIQYLPASAAFRSLIHLYKGTFFKHSRSSLCFLPFEFIERKVVRVFERKRKSLIFFLSLIYQMIANVWFIWTGLEFE